MNLRAKREIKVTQRDSAWRALTIVRTQRDEDIAARQRFITLLDGAIQQIDELIAEEEKEQAMKEPVHSGKKPGK